MEPIIHLSSNPFPVSKSFFGQTFVISSLLRQLSMKNGPVPDELWCQNRGAISDVETYDRITSGIALDQLSSHLRHTYSIDGEPSPRFLTSLEQKVEQGLEPVIVNHYPIGKSSSKFISSLHNWIHQSGYGGSIQLVAYIHTLSDIYGKSTLNESLGRVADSYNHIIGVSDAVSADFQGLLGRPVQTILNGISMSQYTPVDVSQKQWLRNSIGLRPGLEKVVCFSGRLSREKGVSILLETLQQVNKNGNGGTKDVGFVIATSQLLNEDSPNILRQFMGLEKLISEDRLKFVLDISKYVRGDTHFRPDYLNLLQMVFSTSEDAAKLKYGKVFGGFIDFPVQTIADIAMQPSLSEAFGLVFVESVASGAYVLANKCGGISEVVAEGNGMLFDLPKNGDKKCISEKASEYKEAIVGYKRVPSLQSGNSSIYRFNEANMAEDFAKAITKKNINGPKENAIRPKKAIQ